MTAKMSQGITPYDFVQQVYYMQEKTLLDFWPTDDKYREVLIEANLVLKELEAVEDWTWLRETVILGSCDDVTNEIIQFELPEDTYKVSTLNHDAVRLYPIIGHDIQTTTELVPRYEYQERIDPDTGDPVLDPDTGLPIYDYVPVIDPDTGEQVYDEVTNTVDNGYILDERHYIPVPIASAGDQLWNREKQTNAIGVNQIHDFQLRAVVQGNILKFNRTLLPHEAGCVAVVDVQKHITPFHVCNPAACKLDSSHRCPTAASVYLTEIPDPNYVVMATAARHAEGSPPALARVAGLQDTAQRILSQMRQNDASATDSDYIEWDVPGYIEVI